MAETSKWDKTNDYIVNPLKSVGKKIVNETFNSTIGKNPFDQKEQSDKTNNNNRVKNSELKTAITLLTESNNKINDSVNRGNEIQWQLLSLQSKSNSLLTQIVNKIDNINGGKSSGTIMDNIGDFIGANDNKKGGSTKPSTSIKPSSSKLATGLKIAGSAALIGGAAYEAYDEYQTSGNGKRAASVGLGTLGGGILGGMAAGALGGSVVPGVGTAIGLIGGGIGAYLGSKAGRAGYDMLSSNSAPMDSEEIKKLKNTTEKNSDSITYNVSSFNVNTKEFKINGIPFNQNNQISSGFSNNQNTQGNISGNNTNGISIPNSSSAIGSYSVIGSQQNNQNKNSSYSSDPQTRGARSGLGGKSIGGSTENKKGVYDAFRNAGLSHEAAKSFAAEIGRENDFNSKYLYGTHTDPHNGALNAGMMSWQKERATKLLSHLKEKGLLNEDGSIKKSQESLNEQAKFAIKEMESGELGTKGKGALDVLKDPNSTHQQRAQVLGDDVIKWRRTDPRYANHAQKRDAYYNEMEGISKLDNSSPREKMMPTMLRKNGQSASEEAINQLKPDVKNRLMALGLLHKDNTGENFPVNSANRTYEDQQRLYNNRFNNPNPVARPGTSKHEGGKAFDAPAALLDKYEKDGTLDKLGLHRPYKNDPVHVEVKPDAEKLPDDLQKRLDKIKSDQELIKSASKEQNDEDKKRLFSLKSSPFKILNQETEAQKIYKEQVKQSDIYNPNGAIMAAQRAQTQLKEQENKQGDNLNNIGTKDKIDSEKSNITVNNTISRDDIKNNDKKSNIDEKKPSATSPSRDEIKEYFYDGI